MTTRALSDPLATLFDSGTCAGMTDGELLERFRTGRDEGGERAFEALVTRHGPMVLGICRHLLDDPADVHDAFQAVFLVLARRAVAIRKGESVGSWLYGVAVRVAARARATAIRRRVRDRRVLSAASVAARPGDALEANPGDRTASDDAAAVVHQEVLGLPERYRSPILLCYFEGLTHDEAAARLQWPVGTVRSRLARARDRLRVRLTRRGVADLSAIGPFAHPGWTRAVAVPAPLARVAVRLAADRAAIAGSAASITLADGVLKTMMLKKLAVAAGVVASLGIGGGSATLLVRRAGAQDKPAAAAVVTPPKPAETPALLAELLDAARERYRIQAALYESGSIALRSLLEAGIELDQAELLAAKTDAERKVIGQRRVNRLKELERTERIKYQQGQSTSADAAEARQARLKAEFMMTVDEEADAEKASLRRRVAELERKVEQLQKDRGAGGRE